MVIVGIINGDRYLKYQKKSSKKGGIKCCLLVLKFYLDRFLRQGLNRLGRICERLINGFDLFINLSPNSRRCIFFGFLCAIR